MRRQDFTGMSKQITEGSGIGVWASAVFSDEYYEFQILFLFKNRELNVLYIKPVRKLLHHTASSK